MNAERYQEQVLDGIFFDYWMQMSEERGQILFQQDGAPSHTAKSTQEWLKRNSIDTLPHHHLHQTSTPLSHYGTK